MNDPLNPQPGDQYHRVTATGVRRYEVSETFSAAVGNTVHLTCLDPPLPDVAGYRGGAAREARIHVHSLRDPLAGWFAGHDAVADAA